MSLDGNNEKHLREWSPGESVLMVTDLVPIHEECPHWKDAERCAL
ncbi:hypothetical protein [Archangium lipolyticum]|nr:hypothetical protein [Archangium lipolyticum]